VERGGRWSVGALDAGADLGDVLGGEVFGGLEVVRGEGAGDDGGVDEVEFLGPAFLGEALGFCFEAGDGGRDDVGPCFGKAAGFHVEECALGVLLEEDPELDFCGGAVEVHAEAVFLFWEKIKAFPGGA